jgi:hypothetical protein
MRISDWHETESLLRFEKTPRPRAKSMLVFLIRSPRNFPLLYSLGINSHTDRAFQTDHGNRWGLRGEEMI